MNLDSVPGRGYLWRWDGDDFVLERMSQSAEALWGGGLAELRGARAQEWFGAGSEVSSALLRCLRDRITFGWEATIHSRLTGSSRRLVFSCTPSALDAVVLQILDAAEGSEADDPQPEGSASLFREYFQRLPTPAYLWRKVGDDFVLAAANSAGLALADGAIVDLLGGRAQDLALHRPDVVRPGLRADLDLALGGEPFSRELSVQGQPTGKHWTFVVTHVGLPPDGVVVHTEDVTESRRLRADLLNQYETSRAILEASTQAILLVASDGTVLDINEAVSRSRGIPREEIVGGSVFGLFAPEVAASRRRSFEGVIRTRRQALIEDEDAGRYFRSRLYPVFDTNGAVTRVVIYADDVSEERRAREALRRTRELHEEAQRIAHLGHWEWDTSSDKASWSPETHRIFGTDPETFRPTYETFLDLVHPDDRQDVVDRLGRSLEHGRSFDEEFRVRRGDGSVRLVRERGEVSIDDEDRRVIVGTVLDITELRAAERTMKEREDEMVALMEGNPDGICLVAPDGIIHACNAALGRMTGHAEKQLLGLSITDLLAPEEHERVLRRSAEVLAGAHTELSEYMGVRADGTPTPVEVSAALTTFRGEPALVCTVRDVGKRKEVERDFARSRDTLRALIQHVETVREQERVLVARDLHDELGGVLTALKIDLGSIQGSERRIEPETLAPIVDLVDRALAGTRAAISRLRPGVLDDLGLGAAIEWLARDLHHRSGIACSVSLPDEEPDLPAQIATAMFRITQEALTNVARHSKATRVFVSLRTDSERLELTVEDDGSGFDVAHAERVGFGLLGMRERVAGLNGEIRLTSSAGEGAAIQVELPRS